MKTLLIFPPAADPAHPPLGVASLAGFLRDKGEEVELLDANILSYYWLLSKENLNKCVKKMKRRFRQLDTLDSLPLNDAEEYRLLAETLLAAPYLIDHVEFALSGLKNPDVYTHPTDYARWASILGRAMELVSAAHYPARWYIRDFTLSYSPTRSSDVRAAVSDIKQNFFIPFYRSLLPSLRKINAEIIGISINYYCQLIPGITLAALIKKHVKPGVIVIGGGLMCFFDTQWDVLLAFKRMVDAIIPFEGEFPLLALIEAIKNNHALSGVPGVVAVNSHSVHYTPPAIIPDPEELPAPDFDGLPLTDYVSPRLVLPLLTSRGCYWGRCAFCSHAHLYRRKFRQRSIAAIIADMKTLADKLNAVDFYFTDECLAPAISQALARRISDEKLPFRWFGESRFEQELDDTTLHELSAGGCRMLIFGLESGVKRLLDHMNKGTAPDEMSKILTGCKKAGIRTFIMFFAGFPSETIDEARKTVRFIEDHFDCINQVAFTNFILEKRSPVYDAPEKYGISSIHPYPDEDLKIYTQYTVKDGLSANEAVNFLDTIKKRPKIHALLDVYLLSRSHLIFLPLEKHTDKPNDIVVMDFSDPRSLYPALRDGWVTQTFAFNLDRISERSPMNRPDTNTPSIPRSPTGYLYQPEEKKLKDVGENGLRLIRACTGAYCLADILDAIGEPNRETALQFYKQLHLHGVLTCAFH
ncbi:MAG: B12-binding domain-containing radical SAM protein [Candidatus Omnitrophota bacterium]